MAHTQTKQDTFESFIDLISFLLRFLLLRTQNSPGAKKSETTRKTKHETIMKGVGGYICLKPFNTLEAQDSITSG